MHHLYPSLKGDQLCPLGFHPQTRYPTRCKRCFRDYKEHGSRRNVDDIALSSPNILDDTSSRSSSRSWMSTQNLSSCNNNHNSDNIELKRRPQSWASTPDIKNTVLQKNELASIPKNNTNSDKNDVDVTIKIPPVPRRHTTTLDLKEVEDSLLQTHLNITSDKLLETAKVNSNDNNDLIILSTDNLAERARKISLIKKQRSNLFEYNKHKTKNDSNFKNSKSEDVFYESIDSTHIKINDIKINAKKNDAFNTLIHRKETKEDKKQNSKDTEEIYKLNLELESMKLRAERAEREKSDILLRRLASLDTTCNRTAASEVLILQEKLNEVNIQLEKALEDKYQLNKRMKELENNPNSSEYELKCKLYAAEQLCEELMEENQKSKKEICNLKSEMDEMQDIFRDNDEKIKSNIEKELDKCTKNCRILSFKLKKYERKIDTLEKEKQNNTNVELSSKIKRLEEELNGSNEIVLNLKMEIEKLRNENKPNPLNSGVIGKAKSIDNKYEKDTLTYVCFQENSQHMCRDLHDSLERESDLKDQLKFTEEEVESLRQKVTRIEDENDSLLIQLKKMMTRSKLQPESSTKDDDEGISEEDDPTELKILLELNEQEMSKLRNKIDCFQKENEELKNTYKDTQEKIKNMKMKTKLTNASIDTNKNLKSISDDLIQLCDVILKKKFSQEVKDSVLMDNDNNSLKNKKFNAHDQINLNKQEMQWEQLSFRKPKTVTDLTPKSTLKKWVEEQEHEISDLRAELLNSNVYKLKKLETNIKTLTEKLECADATNAKLIKFEEDCKQSIIKIQNLEEKIKLQEQQINKNDKTKQKISSLQSEYENELKEKRKLEIMCSDLKNELLNEQNKLKKTKTKFEKEMTQLKSLQNVSDTAQLDNLKKQIISLENSLSEEKTRYNDINAYCEKISEEKILMCAKLSAEKQNIEIELKAVNEKLEKMNTLHNEHVELNNKYKETQRKLKTFETCNSKNSALEYEKTMLKNKIAQKEQEYQILKKENEMNIDLNSQLRKDNDDLIQKINDFKRIEQAKSSIIGHNAQLEAEIKTLNERLENGQRQFKSDIAAARLRYEQQVNNLNAEMASMQRQCEKFKKDRDTLKQMLESAHKKVRDLKAHSTMNRLSRSSIQSSDEDDKNKIVYLEQQIGYLEDQLMESKLNTSKIKMELVSERSSNEIKISEMQSKLNEYEENRLIGTGRTKIPGIKTKLELSWQKEREDQQRLLQETSTLSRDLRQTLFEVERERDKERLETKRKLEQLKRSNEDEIEEGRKKISELQCDLLELRDVHAKLRTSNEKLRRERERNEKEIIKKRVEKDTISRKVDTLLQLLKEFGNTESNLQSNRDSVKGDTPILLRLTEACEEIRKAQRTNEDTERNSLRRSTLRRAASQDNDTYSNNGLTLQPLNNSVRTKNLRPLTYNGNPIRKSLSLDHTIQKDQGIWCREDGSASSIQSIQSELGIMRDKNYDSRFSGGSTQSELYQEPRKKKKTLMGKLRSLTKSGRSSETDISIQGSDSDISVASDFKNSKKDLRGRFSGIFRRSESASRNGSVERIPSNQKPVSVTIVGETDSQSKELHEVNSVSPKETHFVKRERTLNQKRRSLK